MTKWLKFCAGFLYLPAIGIIIFFILKSDLATNIFMGFIALVACVGCGFIATKIL